MNRRAAILLLTGCLSLLPVLQLRGQETDGIRRIEPGRISAKAHEALRLYFETALPAWTDTRWLQVEVDPIARARRALRERMQQEAEKATLAAEETAARAIRRSSPSGCASRWETTRTVRGAPIQTGRSTPGRSVSTAARCPGRQAHAPAKGVGPDPGPQIAFGERKGVATNTLRREEGGRRRFRTTRPPKRERRLRPPKSGRVVRQPGNRAAGPAAENRRAAPATEKRKGSSDRRKAGETAPAAEKQKGCFGRPSTKRNRQTRNAIKSNTTKWQKKHR